MNNTLNRRRIFILLFGLLALGALVLLHPAYRRSVGITLSALLGRHEPPRDLQPARERWAERLGPDTSLPLPETEIVIHKSERRLELFSAGELIAEYPIALGGEPEGPKRRQGDNRTPEGRYTICTRLDYSRFHLFLGISYPNSTDAGAALTEGIIDQATADKIRKAAERGKTPPWDSPAGGAIGIHGGGTNGDWTWGCIALENEAIEDLFVATDFGTRV